MTTFIDLSKRLSQLDSDITNRLMQLSSTSLNNNGSPNEFNLNYYIKDKKKPIIALFLLFSDLICNDREAKFTENELKNSFNESIQSISHIKIYDYVSIENIYNITEDIQKSSDLQVILNKIETLQSTDYTSIRTWMAKIRNIITLDDVMVIISYLVTNKRLIDAILSINGKIRYDKYKYSRESFNFHRDHGHPIMEDLIELFRGREPLRSSKRISDRKIATRHFKINNFIELRLEKNNSNIYVNGELFRMCKSLILNISRRDIKKYDEINSIDDAIKLNKSMGGGHTNSYNIDPETEFWGHCSNLQAWCEHDYDTRLLHSNLSFPLLKKLCEAGDKKAKRIFKEEVSKRILSDNRTVILFSIEKGYLDTFTTEEFKYVITELKERSNIDRLGLKKILNSMGYRFLVNKHDNKALECFKLILDIDGKNIGALHNIAMIYLDKQFDKAIDICLKIIELNPKESLGISCEIFNSMAGKEKLNLNILARVLIIYFKYGYSISSVQSIIPRSLFLNK